MVLSLLLVLLLLVLLPLLLLLFLLLLSLPPNKNLPKLRKELRRGLDFDLVIAGREVSSVLPRLLLFLFLREEEEDGDGVEEEEEGEEEEEEGLCFSSLCECTMMGSLLRKEE